MDDLSDSECGDWHKNEQATSWISSNIRQRDCFKFSGRNEYDDTCTCGGVKEEHVKKEGTTKWKKSVNTTTSPTKVYGAVEVEDVHEIQYIRLDEDTDTDDIEHLLHEVWNLRKPKWILSLLGDIQGTKTDEYIAPALTEVFETLPASLDLLLISDGLRHGLSDYIKTAKDDIWDEEKVTSIGLQSWGEMVDFDEIDHREGTGNWKDRAIKQFHTAASEKLGEGITHLIMVDNGTYDQYLCSLSTMSFFADLKVSLAEIGDPENAIPAVTILNGGETFTFEGVKNCIQEEIPIVIIKGSGGVADVITTAVEESKTVSQKSLEGQQHRHGTIVDQKTKKKIKKKIKDVFFDDESADAYLQVTIQCLQRRDLLTVVDLTSSHSLFQAIVSAIIKSKSSDELMGFVDDFLPTPVYNRRSANKADKHIEVLNETTDKEEKKEETRVTMKSIFKEALLHNKHECVEFILDCDEKYILDLDLLTLFIETKDDLQKNVKGILRKCADQRDPHEVKQTDIVPDEQWMHAHTANDSFDHNRKCNVCDNKIKGIRYACSKCPEYNLCTNCKTQGKHSQHEVWRIVTSSQKILAVFTSALVQRFVPRICRMNDNAEPEAVNDDGQDGATDSQKSLKMVYTGMFLWAFLTQRNTLAQVFWKRGQDLVVSALMAATVMDSLADMTFNSKKKTARQATASYFRVHAIGTLDTCYADDKDKTVQLFVKNRKTNIWDVEPLALSFVRKNNSMFRSEGLDYYTFSTWIGNISKKTSTWRIVLSALCPLLIWLLITMKWDDEKAHPQAKIKAAQKKMAAGPSKEDLYSKEDTPGMWTRFKEFYKAPIVKYILNLCVYCVFLGLYAHLLLVALTFDFKRRWEIPLLIFMVAFVIEECIQVFHFALESKHKKIEQKKRKRAIGHMLRKYIAIYFQDYWNILDIVCILGFILGYTLRLFAVSFGYGRLFLSLNYMCFFWRILQAFATSKSLGPMLIMVFKMVIDLVPFLVILFVVIASYAVATEAIMYPNVVWSVGFVFNLPRKAFWQIFGELFLDELEDGCTQLNCPDQPGRSVVPFLLAAYIVATNVLLLNIIIARFNNIFTSVQEVADEVWSRQKCRLMLEYADRPPLPVPFSIFWRIGLIGKALIKGCRKCCHKNDKVDKLLSDRTGTEDTANANPAFTESETFGGTISLHNIHVPDVASSETESTHAQPLDTADAAPNNGIFDAISPSTAIFQEVAPGDDRESHVEDQDDLGSEDQDEDDVDQPQTTSQNALQNPWDDLSDWSDDESIVISDDDSLFDDDDDKVDDEDPLDAFERANGEFYVQTEKLKT